MNRIKELRIALGLTQTELASQIGLNQTAIGKYEREQLEPGLETLKKLSEIFECSIDYIIGHSDDFGNITIKKEKSAEISPDGKELLEIFNDLPAEYQAQILEYARYFETRNVVSKRKNKNGA